MKCKYQIFLHRVSLPFSLNEFVFLDKNKLIESYAEKQSLHYNFRLIKLFILNIKIDLSS